MLGVVSDFNTPELDCYINQVYGDRITNYVTDVHEAIVKNFLHSKGTKVIWFRSVDIVADQYIAMNITRSLNQLIMTYKYVVIGEYIIERVYKCGRNKMRFKATRCECVKPNT